MHTHAPSVRKVTISLPPSLLEFTDRQAVQLKISRSEIIGRVLAQVKAAEEERLAAEGYRFYSQEASDFAAASTHAFAEV
jgi:metal-responsive CopG/Arc/MetJ family transcriptional regulator